MIAPVPPYDHEAAASRTRARSCARAAPSCRYPIAVEVAFVIVAAMHSRAAWQREWRPLLMRLALVQHRMVCTMFFKKVWVFQV